MLIYRSVSDNRIHQVRIRKLQPRERKSDLLSYSTLIAGSNRRRRVEEAAAQCRQQATVGTRPENG
jgi:hypothetical protein